MIFRGYILFWIQRSLLREFLLRGQMDLVKFMYRNTGRQKNIYSMFDLD